MMADDKDGANPPELVAVDWYAEWYANQIKRVNEYYGIQ